MNPVALSLTLLQQTCVYLVVAYLLAGTRIFIPLMHVTIRLPQRTACYVVCSLFCIMGTYLGLHIDDSIAHTRTIGSVLGGVLGGPVVGLAVGLTGGLHRYSLGGSSALPCAIATVVGGLIGGGYHRYMISRGKAATVFRPVPVALVTLVAIVVEMAILLLMLKYPANWHLVEQIAIPMGVANTLGAGMFMRILVDRRKLYERQSTVFSTKALAIAARVEGLLREGIDPDASARAARLVKVIQEETGVGAVAMTDTHQLVAFTGIGADHHLPGTIIESKLTLQAIERNEVVYADGNEVPYRCSIHAKCPLASCLIIPLTDEENQVIGTIKLYEPRTRLFSNINRTLGEGIGRLLSNQILAGRYLRQREMLQQSEIKLLQAQINPHFLFNALNTLIAVIRRDPERACTLVFSLSTFFRSNLKRPSEDARLIEELAHVSSYLEIEQARFGDRLQVAFDVPDRLQHVRLPAFSLQPVVENAIKHGTSQLLGIGRVKISARQEGNDLLLCVEDNAGLYKPPAEGNDGLGVNLVRRRIANRYGAGYGMDIECEPEVMTRVTLRLPFSTTDL